MSLHSKAILLRCTVRQWDGAIRDVTASKQFTRQHNMDENAGIFSKYLISKSALQPIRHAEMQIRKHHNRMTIPWSLDGVGLITNDKLLEYMQTMRLLINAFNEAVDNFIRHYEIHVSDAKLRLGDRFEIREFPSHGQLRQKFCVEVTPLPVPSSGHILADLTESGIDATEIDKEVSKAMDKAMARMWSAVHARLSQLCAVLDDPEHRVHKSHFELLGDFMDKLEEFNLFESQQFATFIGSVRANVINIPIDDVRNDPATRQRVANHVRAAISAAAQFTGDDNGYTSQEDNQ